MVYHYTLPDTFKIRHYLRTKVPPELASIILDEAEVWIRQVATQTRPTMVAASWEQMSTSMHYLITGPLPSLKIGNDQFPVKVRRVRFTLRSGDQGWSDYHQHHATYNNSGSWFEAGILKPHPAPTPTSTLFPGVPLPTALINQMFFGPPGCDHELQNPLGPLPASSLPDFPSGQPIQVRRWFLQANVHASRVLKEHVVEWNHDDCDFPPKEHMNGSGSGYGKGFIKALRDGYHICVVGRAQTPGWENRIQEAKVETFFTFSGL